jgi:hypothetical protein
MANPKFIRPPLRKALDAWQQCLASQNLPVQCLWIFAENLCIEPSRTTPGSFRVGFQTKFTLPANDALEIAYDVFGGTGARMVFYRLGSNEHGSVCMLLCDPWFEHKHAGDGFIRHDGWGISFFPGPAGEIEEIIDLHRWLRRVQNHRALHAYDFAMSLATIDEIKIHGRVLLPYQRYAESMLNRLRRIHGNPG